MSYTRRVNVRPFTVPTAPADPQPLLYEEEEETRLTRKEELFLDKEAARHIYRLLEDPEGVDYEGLLSRKFDMDSPRYDKACERLDETIGAWMAILRDVFEVVAPEEEK